MKRTFPLAALLLGLTACMPTTDPQALERGIMQAGNADSDADRLEILLDLRDAGHLNASDRRDLDSLTAFVERWMHGPRLEWFSRPIRQTGTYDFGLADDSPFIPITDLYLARMRVWFGLEHGDIWSLPDRRLEHFASVRREFESLRARFPENRIVAMYLGEPIPWDKPLAVPKGAPLWAVYQREAVERLADIIHWWIDHRMAEDASYGGGWGDDCEMWRWWMPVLVAFEDPKAGAAQERFSRSLLSQAHMARGYTNRLSDVEHTAEDAADAITPMMFLEPDDPDWVRRALRLADLMDSLWTGTNERGFLQFKSTYFTSDTVDVTPRRACDTVYHPRVVQPALLYWQRTGDPRLTDLFTRWLETWVDATRRAERGKPAGVIPSAIHWPDGAVGGLGAAWWNPDNYTDNPLYVWPSAMPMMTNALLLAGYMSGRDRFLDPLRSMAEIRLQAVQTPSSEPPEPGSRAWCGLQMEGIREVAAKYRLLTGGTEFDDLIEADGSPYERFLLFGEDGPLEEALRHSAQALRVDFEGYTSEVRFTDRVLRFPQLFAQPAMLPHSDPGRFVPDTELLFSTLTGEPGDGLYFPLNAVRWLTPPKDLAARVRRADAFTFEADLYHFGGSERTLEAELYLLDPGSYRVRLLRSESGALISDRQLTVEAGRPRVRLALPPGVLCRVTVEPDHPSRG